MRPAFRSRSPRHRATPLPRTIACTYVERPHTLSWRVPMNFRSFIGIFTSWTLLSVASAPATPLRLTVRPHGTNEVEFTLAPTVPGAYYGVMARSNSVDGHWLSF